MTISDNILGSYLGSFSHEGIPLTFNYLRMLSAESLRETYSHYDETWVKNKVLLSLFTFSYIHETILKSTSLTAAQSLGFSDSSLDAYLGRIEMESKKLDVNIYKSCFTE